MSRLSLLLDLLASSPKDSFLLFALAKEYEKAGDDDNALAYYLQLREGEPGYVGLYYHLGKLYQRRQDLDRALEAYKTGMDVAKKAGDGHALSELAGAKMEISDEDEDDV
jgi:tetratricopeptide (TPR) repeat protein